MRADCEQRIIILLQGVADGRGTVLDLSRDFGLNYNSVKNMLKDKYDETGAECLSHLVAIYFRLGLIR